MLILKFFKSQKWKPFSFQETFWKTYAAVMGIFAKIMASPPKPGIKALYITPLRALARDIEIAIKMPVEKQGWPLKIEARAGDTSYAVKKKQIKNLAGLKTFSRFKDVFYSAQ